MGDTLDLTPSVPTIMLTISARGPLTLMLMPTPLDRSTVDFPMSTLLPLAMPTPPSSPTHTPDTLVTLDIPVTTDLTDTPPTLVKQHSSKQPNRKIAFMKNNVFH